MKQTELYFMLQEVTQKLDIKFKEKNFRNSGVKVYSGLCKIEGELCFFMDKHLKISEKNRVLARCIAGFSTDDICIAPAVREYLACF